jgi:hypothetical protein
MGSSPSPSSSASHSPATRCALCAVLPFKHPEHGTPDCLGTGPASRRAWQTTELSGEPANENPGYLWNQMPGHVGTLENEMVMNNPHGQPSWRGGRGEGAPCSLAERGPASAQVTTLSKMILSKSQIN